MSSGKCLHCGNTLRGTDRYCGRCGRPVASPDAGTTPIATTGQAPTKSTWGEQSWQELRAILIASNPLNLLKDIIKDIIPGGAAEPADRASLDSTIAQCCAMMQGCSMMGCGAVGFVLCLLALLFLLSLGR